MSEKVIGYVLLFAGLAVVCFAGFSVYSVFTKHSKPVELFDFPSVSISADALFDEPQFSKGEAPQIELLPSKILNDTSNTLAHLFLMGFVAGIGSRISSIGASLVRPIVVKLKSDTPTSKNETQSQT